MAGKVREMENIFLQIFLERIRSGFSGIDGKDKNGKMGCARFEITEMALV